MESEHIEALVSERVFGQSVIWLRIGAEWRYTPYVYDRNAAKAGAGYAGCSLIGGYTVIGVNEQGEPVEIYGHTVDKYMSDMTAAWKIVERFGVAEVRKWPNVQRYERTPYSCSLATNGKTFSAWGVTPAEAICLAALHAVGVERAAMEG